jgi:uncharacterized peroxidase-related enzyme
MTVCPTTGETHVPHSNARRRAGARKVAAPLLAAVQKQLGTVPNLFRVVANSPAALEAYVGFSGALGKGVLATPSRERIALAVAEVNGCDYCLSAHTYLARNLAKLDDAEITANRNGASIDIKADVAVRFAAKLARERGRASEADIAALKHAGYSDAEIVEIIAHVALNIPERRPYVPRSDPETFWPLLRRGARSAWLRHDRAAGGTGGTGGTSSSTASRASSSYRPLHRSARPR